MMSPLTTWTHARQFLLLFASFRSPQLLLLLTGLIGMVRIVIAPFSYADLLIFIVGTSVWPLLEWLVHRYILHFPARMRAGKPYLPLISRIHRFHHHHPRDLQSLFFPFQIVIPTFVILTGIGWILTRNLPITLSAGFEILLMLTIYELFHFLAHTAYRPPWTFIRTLKRNHLRHHFRNQEYWFGFTATWPDLLFGTVEASARPPSSSELEEAEAPKSTLTETPDDDHS